MISNRDHSVGGALVDIEKAPNRAMQIVILDDLWQRAVDETQSNAADIQKQTLVRVAETPVDLLIFCPNCGKQHVDKPEPDVCACGHFEGQHRARRHGRIGGQLVPPETNLSCTIIGCNCVFLRIVEGSGWTNPPHKSHTCRTDYAGCGKIFRIADFPTNGVESIKTVGKDDTWLRKESGK